MTFFKPRIFATAANALSTNSLEKNVLSWR